MVTLVPAVVLLVLVAGSTDTVGWAVLVLELAASRALVSCSTWLSGGLPGLDGGPADRDVSQGRTDGVSRLPELDGGPADRDVTVRERSDGQSGLAGLPIV